MEHTFLKWILGITLFYAIFMLIWKRFWDKVDPLPPPGPLGHEFESHPDCYKCGKSWEEHQPPKIRRRHNDDE